jgi:hypothetical protein
MILAVDLIGHQLINRIGDKRRRDDSSAPVAKQNVSASGLATIRKTFRGLYAQRKAVLAEVWYLLHSNVSDNFRVSELQCDRVL